MKRTRHLLIFLLFSLMLTNVAWAEKVLHDLTLTLPVFIELKDGGSGSGFFVSGDKGLFLVTAAHVLYRLNSNGEIILNSKKCAITSYSEKQELVKLNIDLDGLQTEQAIKVDAVNDIAAVRIAETVESKYKFNSGTTVESYPDPGVGSLPLTHYTVTPQSGIRYFDQVLISNDVFLFGYPTGLSLNNLNLEYNRPLLRKGIVAGKYPNSKKIVLDCPVYQGNSGGPVLMIDEDRFLIIGLVTNFIPLIEEWKNSLYPISNVSVSNSGYSVVAPMDYVVDLLSKF